MTSLVRFVEGLAQGGTGVDLRFTRRLVASVADLFVRIALAFDLPDALADKVLWGWGAMEGFADVLSIRETADGVAFVAIGIQGSGERRAAERALHSPPGVPH